MVVNVARLGMESQATVQAATSPFFLLPLAFARKTSGLRNTSLVFALPEKCECYRELADDFSVKAAA